VVSKDSGEEGNTSLLLPTDTYNTAKFAFVEAFLVSKDHASNPTIAVH
jgi:hypothetical protein